MFLIKVFGFIGLFLLCESKNIFMPNLPLGEYRTVTNKLYKCGSTKNHSFLGNIYLNKKSASRTEIKGNITLLIPFDDTITLDINLSSWGSTGGWIPNSNIFNTKKACSNIKNLSGRAWFTFLKHFNISSDNCPIPPNTYVTAGIDLKDIVEHHNWPKVYFYGKYKAMVNLKNVQNKVLGCEVVEFDLLRPWEKPI